MDKIRITKDENGAVILRFEKREDCEKYTDRKSTRLNSSHPK